MSILSRHLQRRAIAAPLALLAACGGGSPGESSSLTNFGLRLSSDSTVAGVQWSMQVAPANADAQMIAARAESALQTSATVMTRAAASSPTTGTYEWIIFTPGSAGSRGWTLFDLSAPDANSLPLIQDAACADGYGNPVTCTLSWERR